MSKELTTEQRGGIIFCRQRGDSYRTIAATIGCGLSTVFDTLKRMDDTGTVNSKLRSGRPPLIKSSQRKRLKRVVTNDKGKIVAYALEKLNNSGKKRPVKMFQLRLLVGHFVQLG